MGGSGSFKSILMFSIFCVGVWLAGNFAKRFGLNDQVPTILAGVVMGPYGLKVLPDTYATCRANQQMGEGNLQFEADVQAEWGSKCNDADYRAEEEYPTAEYCLKKKGDKMRIEDCLTYPDVFTVIGHLGVSLLIFRAGMHFDPYGGTAILKESMIHGFLGTAVPAAIGYAFVAFWFDSDGTEPPLSSWAVGVSLAPTSIGMAIGLLLDSGMAATEFGQGIIMGSLIDDIWALGAFEVLMQAAENDGAVEMKTIIKSCAGFVFIAMGVIMSIGGWKPLMEKPHRALMKKYPPQIMFDDFGNEIYNRFPVSDQFTFFAMVVTVIGLSKFTSLFGSHLWGCFMAGIMFAPVAKALKIWRYQTKKLQAWFLRFFFAGSVGFSLNVEALMDTEAVWKGLILGAVGAIGGKVLAGFWLGDAIWIVGWAMTCRAEFAYLVAQMCFWKGLMSTKMFSITLWALFLATLAGPIGYDYALARLKKKGSHILEAEGSEGAREQPGDANPNVAPAPEDDMAGSGASVFRKKKEGQKEKAAANLAVNGPNTPRSEPDNNNEKAAKMEQEVNSSKNKIRTR